MGAMRQIHLCLFRATNSGHMDRRFRVSLKLDLQRPYQFSGRFAAIVKSVQRDYCAELP
jgi:hypothetical protein